MAQSIGKVHTNGTLNDGSFYSIQDVDVLMDGVNGDIADIEDDIDDIEGDITTIGGNITSLTGRVEALEQAPSGGSTLLNMTGSKIDDYKGKQLYDAVMNGGLFHLVAGGGSNTMIAPLTTVWKDASGSPSYYCFIFTIPDISGDTVSTTISIFMASGDDGDITRQSAG